MWLENPTKFNQIVRIVYGIARGLRLLGAIGVGRRRVILLWGYGTVGCGFVCVMLGFTGMQEEFHKAFARCSRDRLALGVYPRTAVDSQCAAHFTGYMRRSCACLAQDHS